MMATLGEIVVIAQGMRSQFGPDVQLKLAKDIADHLREGNAETARFWQRVVDAMSALDNDNRFRSRAAKPH